MLVKVEVTREVACYQTREQRWLARMGMATASTRKIQNT